MARDRILWVARLSFKGKERPTPHVHICSLHEIMYGDRNGDSNVYGCLLWTTFSVTGTVNHIFTYSLMEQVFGFGYSFTGGYNHVGSKSLSEEHLTCLQWYIVWHEL